MKPMVRSFVSVCCLFFANLSSGYAADFTGSIGQMPVVSESHDKGVFTDVVKAMARVTGKTVEFQVVPFARSMQMVQEGKVDFHLPLIKPLDMSKVPFSVSTATLMHANFVLYYNKNKPIDIKHLEGKNLETDVAHVQYFPFKTTPSPDVAASLKKVQMGRIDGFIHNDNVCEPVIKANNLDKIGRELYQRFEVKFVLPKGGENGPADQFITEAKQKLRATGEWQKLMGPYDAEEGK